MSAEQMFQAIAQLVDQQRIQAEQHQALMQVMAAAQGAGRGGDSGKSWDHPDRFRDLPLFSGNKQEYEEWAVKLRSIIRAGSTKVGHILDLIETDCTEEGLSRPQGRLDQLGAIDDSDKQFVNEVSAKLYHILLTKTTGDANAVIRRTSSDRMEKTRIIIEPTNVGDWHSRYIFGVKPPKSGTISSR